MSLFPSWKNSRYTELIRLCFQHKWIVSLGAVSTVLCNPGLNRPKIVFQSRSEVYIYSDVPHTQTVDKNGSFQWSVED